MAAKLHLQLLNYSSGMCRVELIRLKVRSVVIHSNQVRALIKQEKICTDLFAKALMGFHGALAVLEAVLVCTSCRYHI